MSLLSKQRKFKSIPLTADNVKLDITRVHQKQVAVGKGIFFILSIPHKGSIWTQRYTVDRSKFIDKDEEARYIARIKDEFIDRLKLRLEI